MSADSHPDFPVLGEPLALDLINTVVASRDGEVDLLRTPVELEAWLRAEAERLPEPGRALRAADLHAVRAIREQITDAVEHARHQRRPPIEVLHELTEAQRAAPEYRELGWDGTAVTADPQRAGDDAVRLVAQFAEAATDLLTSGAVTRVRQCERSDCRMLFLPAHSRRRWCSTTCGNRVRVARYYERHKTR
jgi:predicted RNA-binding Zn ribbon-like protein